ncbi:MAG: hypothetical protein IJW01_00760 [Paludibacteraceae bacterium]|nr:hypothetical protein [Paludibacteraceae bacterium]
MKSYIKTCVLLLAVSMLTFSCDKKNNDTPNDPTKDAADEIAVTADNLEGEWVLVGWKDSEYPDEDMSYIYGISLTICPEGVLIMNWEEIMGNHDEWIYSSTTKQLIFKDSTLENENLVFEIESFKEKSMRIRHDQTVYQEDDTIKKRSITLTLERK